MFRNTLRHLARAASLATVALANSGCFAISLALYQPDLAVEVIDPIDGASVEGTVVPVKVRVRHGRGDYQVFVETLWNDALIPAFIWPDREEANVELGTTIGTNIPFGFQSIIVHAWDPDDEDRLEGASLGVSVELKPLGSSTNYPAREADAGFSDTGAP